MKWGGGRGAQGYTDKNSSKGNSFPIRKTCCTPLMESEFCWRSAGVAMNPSCVEKDDLSRMIDFGQNGMRCVFDEK